MKNSMIIIILFLGVALDKAFGEIKTTCDPIMFKNTDLMPHSIAVNALKYDTSNAVGITKMTNEMLSNFNEIYNCVYTEAGHSADLKTLVKEEQVVQLQNLRIISLPTFKDQKMKCTDQQGKEYLYLGYINGTFFLDKKFSVEDPHFYLHNFWGKDTWYIDAVGKFYPCPKEGVDEPNAVFHSIGTMTIMKVLKNFQFADSWPSMLLSDDGAPIKSSLIHEFERRYMHLSDNLQWISLLEGSSGVHTNLRDDKITLRRSSTSKLYKATGIWVVTKNQWYGSFDGPVDHWQDFFEDFFPTKMPFSGFEIEKLGKALPQIISGGLERLSFKVTQDKEKEPFHDIYIDGTLEYSSHSDFVPPFLDEYTFSLRIFGSFFGSMVLNFGYTDNRCSYKDEQLQAFEDFRKNLTRHARPKSFQKEIFNSVTSRSGNEICKGDLDKVSHKAIQLHKLEFKWQANGLSDDWEAYFVTVTWTEYNKSTNTYTMFTQESLVNAYDIIHSLKKQH